MPLLLAFIVAGVMLACSASPCATIVASVAMYHVFATIRSDYRRATFLDSTPEDVQL